MRRLIIPLLIILLSYLSAVIFVNRALLFSTFDQSYWKNKYEQSQWKLPLSIRTIGDDGLYLFEGYRLIHGSDPTSSNAEMPPLGKYAIGLSIKMFGNGYIYGFLVTISLVVATYALAKILLKETVLALFVTVLLATDPLITNHYTLTMMDALQGLLFVLFFIFVFTIQTIRQSHQIWYAGFSGLILGLFSATKLPVLAPIMIASCGAYFIGTTKKVHLLIPIIIGAIIGYMLLYSQYFLHGHTLLDWIKIQKWMVSFYLHSNLTPTWGSAISVLFTGMYQNIYSRIWLPASEWSPVWGILMFTSCTTLIARVRSRIPNRQNDVLLATLFAVILLYTCIPFWTRYFVVILPILYIVGMNTFLTQLPNRAKIGIFSLFLTINIGASMHVLFQSPEATAQQYIYNAEHLVFADLYEDTTNAFKKSTSRQAFEQFGFTILSQGEIEFIDITPKTTLHDKWASVQYLDVTATYFTRRLGSFTLPMRIPFVREDGRWRIPWDWSLLMPELASSSALVTTVNEAKRGSIIDTDKKPLAMDIEGSMIWITPGLTDTLKEETLLTLLEKLFNGRIPKVAIHQRFIGNTFPSIAIPLGVVPYDTTNTYLRTLSTFPGITFTKALARNYHLSDVVTVGTVGNTTYPECCSYLYTTTAYTGTSGIEQTQNNTLKGINGGTLQLINKQGAIIKEYINVTKQDGKNVQL